MRDPSNIEELVNLNPDYIGFIFYPRSKRFVGEKIDTDIHALIPVYIQKVGVFVDEPFDSLLEKFRDNKLNMVQLHGNELPDYCERLKKIGIPIIKVFNLSSDFDFTTIEPFEPFCDYYLFDTATPLKGGSGKKFDWEKVDHYTGIKPFFLSGGISGEDMQNIKTLNNKHLHAIDLNSRFEIEPGVKDIPKLKTFVESLRK